MVEEPLVTEMELYDSEYFWKDSCWKFRHGRFVSRSDSFRDLPTLHAELNKAALGGLDEAALLDIIVKSDFGKESTAERKVLGTIAWHWVEKARLSGAPKAPEKEEEWQVMLKKSLIEKGMALGYIPLVIRDMAPYFTSQALVQEESATFTETPKVSQLDLF